MGNIRNIGIITASSLLFSILLTGLSTEMLMPFNIIAGYAVCSGISLYAETKLKWPNDCVINDKKVSGMLLEASFTGNKAAKIVFVTRCRYHRAIRKIPIKQNIICGCNSIININIFTKT